MGPGTTCWPGGVLKCSPGVGGSKMASRGVEWLLTPPTPTYGPEGDRPKTNELNMYATHTKVSDGTICKIGVS